MDPTIYFPLDLVQSLIFFFSHSFVLVQNMIWFYKKSPKFFFKFVAVQVTIRKTFHLAYAKPCVM